MASTFNQEGSALGLAIGVVIILIGHTMNIGLSFMGGVIHGLRLNFLEWYHYCFTGGGRLFKPLQKIRDRK
jgi:V/A-type H+-transporting ATPase subunit I